MQKHAEPAQPVAHPHKSGVQANYAVELSAPLLRLLFVCVFTLIPLHARAQTEPPTAQNTTKQMTEECLAIKTLTPVFCQCAVEASEKFGEDRLLWRWFIAASVTNANRDEDTNNIAKELMDRTARELPGLALRRDREAYIIGLFSMYGNAIKSQCSNVK